MVRLEDYCAMDDSSRILWGKGLDSKIKQKDSRRLSGLLCRSIDIYVHSIFASGYNQFSNLVFIRPERAGINEALLYDFVTSVACERKIMACMHYSVYESMRSLEALGRLEFSTKEKRSLRGFDANKKLIFSRAHYESNFRSGKVKEFFSSLYNWDYLMCAVRAGDDLVFFRGMKVHISGFKPFIY